MLGVLLKTVKLSRLDRRDCQCWEPLPLLELGHGHRLVVELVQVDHQRALGVAGKPVHQHHSTSKSKYKTLISIEIVSYVGEKKFSVAHDILSNVTRQRGISERSVEFCKLKITSDPNFTCVSILDESLSTLRAPLLEWRILV